jgi:uncharacterized membrane protein YqjE
MNPPAGGPPGAGPDARARAPGADEAPARGPAVRAGLYARLQRLLGTTLELVQLRVELLATDVQLGGLRFLDALVWALAALLMLAAGLGLLLAAIVLMLAPEYRLLASVVMAVGLLGAGAFALVRARQRLRAAGGAFGATRAELARDLTALGSGRDGPA